MSYQQAMENVRNLRPQLKEELLNLIDDNELIIKSRLNSSPLILESGGVRITVRTAEELDIIAECLRLQLNYA